MCSGPGIRPAPRAGTYLAKLQGLGSRIDPARQQRSKQEAQSVRRTNGSRGSPFVKNWEQVPVQQLYTVLEAETGRRDRDFIVVYTRALCMQWTCATLDHAKHCREAPIILRNKWWAADH